MKHSLRTYASLKSKLKKYWSLEYVWLYALISILGIAIFFRFYNMPERYVFDFDPTRDALISIVGKEDFRFPLAGPKSGIAEFTFGPWYYYFIITFSILTPFQYAPWIFIGITSVFTVLIYFFIGRFLFDKYFGLILSLIVAIAPAELGPVTGLSNPNLIPFHASLAVLFFVLFVKNKLSFFWIVLWGFIIGVGINHHYQAVGLLFLPIVAILYSLFKRKSVFTSLLCIIGGISVSFIPLLIFNFISNWQTISGFNAYLSEGRSSAPNRWLTYIFDFWPMFWSYVVGVPLILGIIVGVYVLCVNVFAFIKKILPPSYILLFAVFVVNVLFLRYATSVRENYYFLYLHPFIFILWAFAIWYSLKHKYLRFVIFILAYIVFFFTLKEDIRRLPEENESRQVRSYVAIIEETYPSGVQIYRCGERIAHIAQAMTFLLYYDEGLSIDGVAIGIKSDECRDETLFKGISFDHRYGYYLLDFKRFPQAKAYWTPVSPQAVYTENINTGG